MLASNVAEVSQEILEPFSRRMFEECEESDRLAFRWKECGLKGLPSGRPQAKAFGSRRLVREVLDPMMVELFRLHDLNDNGFLEELELIKLNEKIAILHHGRGTDTQEVRTKYRSLFRSKLDPLGQPVPYETFQRYTKEMVDGLDKDPEAQEMILEQFVAEAQSGRRAFDFASLVSESDAPIWGSKHQVLSKSSSEALDTTCSKNTDRSTNCNIYPRCNRWTMLSCCSRPKRCSGVVGGYDGVLDS